MSSDDSGDEQIAGTSSGAAELEGALATTAHVQIVRELATDGTGSMDVGLLLGKPKTVSQKQAALTDPWIPNHAYKFLLHKEGGKQRSFNLTWLRDFSPWLVYSDNLQGALCKYCSLFASTSTGNIHSLVSKPLTKWKKALETFRAHSKSNLHKNCLQSAEHFLNIYEGTESDVVTFASAALSTRISENRLKLSGIIETIIFCGKQNISLRGHREGNNDNMDSEINQGNFKALLQYRATCGDMLLNDHLNNSPKNARYISPQIQNELIEIIGNQVTNTIISDVIKSPYFCVLADETTDVSGIEQMTFCLRYLKNNQIMESFIQFISLQNTTGKTIADTILNLLNFYKLDLLKMRGQGYDGASNMRGEFRGVQARISHLYPMAKYTHCSSHVLNLVIVATCEEPAIRNMIGTVKRVLCYIKDSHIRRTCFEKNLPPHANTKIKTFCETRWVERHTVFLDFVNYFNTFINTLCDMSSSDNNANLLLNAITNFEFCIALKCAEVITKLLLPISRTLQKTDIDLIAAANEIRLVINIVEDYRKNVDSIFSKIFQEVEILARENDIEVRKPRLCGRQKNRGNIPTNTPEAYYRLNLFIPFLDHFLSEGNARFGTLFQRIAQIQHLIPSRINDVGTEELLVYVAEFSKIYDDVDTEQLKMECIRWKAKWTVSAEKDLLPKTCLATLVECSEDFYPNIKKLLEVLAVLPVTTAEAERSFSTLRRLKTWLRSTTSENRMNGLAALNIHYEVKVNINDVINVFANKKHRRMELLFAQ